MRTEGESGPVYLQAKECQGLLGMTRCWKRQEGPSLGPPGPASPCLQASGLHSHARLRVCDFKPQSMVLGDGGPRKLLWGGVGSPLGLLCPWASRLLSLQSPAVPPVV